MYYLPVFVNQSRFHYCKLKAEQSADPSIEHSFVVQQVPGHAVELLRLYKGTRFLSAAGFAADIRLSVRETEVKNSFSDGATMELEVRLKPGNRQVKENPEPEIEKAGFSWVRERGDLFLRYQGTRSGVVRLHFVLEVEGKADHRGSFLIHLAPPRKIFDAVFDFGSEASQIAVHQRGTEPAWEPRINLVDRLIFDFYAPAFHSGKLTRKPPGNDAPRITLSNVDRDRFMAWDHHSDGSTNDRLFNSSFFVLRSYQCDGQPKYPAHLSAEPFAEGDNEWVSLLGDTYDQRYMIPREDRDYEIVPNLKLAELGITRDFPLCIDDRHVRFTSAKVQGKVFRRVLNQFLHLLLREIELEHEDEEGKLLKLTVLVPNIYSQLRVSSLIRNLMEDLRRIIAEEDYNFAGVEVQTLSESDAALLGLLTDPGVEGLGSDSLKNGDHCLVIDSGKGTTDISVLSVGMDNQYNSVFRSGFAGAGNALTYAFADTLFATIAGPENASAREQFLKHFLDDQQDLGSRYLFHRELESIKKHYGKRKSSDYTYDLDEFRKIFSGLRPGEDRLVLLQKLQEKFSRERKTMQDYYGIIGQTIDQLVEMAVKRVRDSRVHKFSVVVLSGRSLLMEDYRKRLEAALQAEFNIGKVIFRPANLKRSCLLGPLNYPQGTNRNSDLIGTPVFPNGGNRLGSFLDRLRGKEQSTRPRNNPIDYDLFKFYLQGVEFQPGRETISISGREPIVNSIPPEERANLVFVGEDFLLRSKHAGMPLHFGHRTGQSLQSDPMAWMSLFPHVGGPGYISPIREQKPPEPEVEPVTPAPPADPPATKAEPKTPPPENPVRPADDDMWDYI